MHGSLQEKPGSARRGCVLPQGIRRSARLPARNWSKCMAGVKPAARKRAKCTAGCRKRGEVHASVRARPFPYISPSSLHLEDFMQGYGGNVRQPAAKRGKWAENHVPRRSKHVHFQHIAARVSPCAANAGNCTKKAVRADLLRAQRGLTGGISLVRPYARGGEPLPQTGDDAAWELGNCRRGRCRRTPSGGRLAKGVSRFRRRAARLRADWGITAGGL